jgi:putative transposon-encoded protein
MVRQIKIKNNKITMEDEFELLFEKEITKFGTGAKIDAPKEYLGKKVYVLVRKK